MWRCQDHIWLLARPECVSSTSRPGAWRFSAACCPSCPVHSGASIITAPGVELAFVFFTLWFCHQSQSANNVSTLFSFRPIIPLLLFHALHCPRNELWALIYSSVCELVGREPKVDGRVFMRCKTRKMCVKSVDASLLSDAVCWCPRQAPSKWGSAVSEITKAYD